MKKILFGFAFVAAIGGAFAGRPSNTNSLSYKQANEVGQPCHVSTNSVACDGGSSTCILPFGTTTRTYFQDNGCNIVLKKP